MGSFPLKGMFFSTSLKCTLHIALRIGVYLSWSRKVLNFLLAILLNARVTFPLRIFYNVCTRSLFAETTPNNYHCFLLFYRKKYRRKVKVGVIQKIRRVIYGVNPYIYYNYIIIIWDSFRKNCKTVKML